MTDLAQIIDRRHELRPLTPAQFAWLTAALDPNRITRRSQSGQQLSYLESWDVRRHLDRIFGFGGWSEIIVESKPELVERDVPKANNGKTPFRCTARTRTLLYIHQLGAIYSGEAVATQSGSVPGDVLDFALKTSASDAIKRAAMNLGTAFGLSLYDKASREDRMNPNYDVVGADWVVAIGQRPLDIAYAQMQQEKRDREMKHELDQWHSQNGGQQQPTAQRPTDAPVVAEDVPAGVEPQVDQQAMQAAQTQVQGAFGG
jgi:hypothetical protein